MLKMLMYHDFLHNCIEELCLVWLFECFWLNAWYLPLDWWMQWGYPSLWGVLLCAGSLYPPLWFLIRFFASQNGHWIGHEAAVRDALILSVPAMAQDICPSCTFASVYLNSTFLQLMHLYVSWASKGVQVLDIWGSACPANAAIDIRPLGCLESGSTPCLLTVWHMVTDMEWLPLAICLLLAWSGF